MFSRPWQSWTNVVVLCDHLSRRKIFAKASLRNCSRLVTVKIQIKILITCSFRIQDVTQRSTPDPVFEWISLITADRRTQKRRWQRNQGVTVVTSAVPVVTNVPVVTRSVPVVKKVPYQWYSTKLTDHQANGSLQLTQTQMTQKNQGAPKGYQCIGKETKKVGPLDHN